MAEIILITGGARSGKSAHALELANGHAQRIFIATAEAFDDEMRERIARHRDERGDAWETIEAPLDLAAAIEGVHDPSAVIVVDCLTVWLGNLMHHDAEFGEAAPILQQTLEAVRYAQAAHVILVTNEVGMSIVPENALARRFRDLAGRVNQRFAAISDQVILTVCGQALTIKRAGGNSSC
jgi:adenosylcobinamide kinase/adenosylcobinamide-phosphate guanylyltransferase